MRTTTDPRGWAENLETLAMVALGRDPVHPEAPEPERRAYLDDFRDESGARPRVVGPFLADLLLLPPVEAPESAAPDESLWWALCGRRPPPPGVIRAGEGPLIHGPGDQTAIEVRTERELCALHALSELAMRTGDSALALRCASAASWHLRELQPDNATNRPWAIQVFVRMAHGGKDTGERDAALVHAQTQLHSCQLALGRPDRLSACILLHAARSLRGHTA